MVNESSGALKQEVEIVRGVRIGRILLVFAVLGAVIALVMTLLNDVPEGALYEMGQIAGFMVVLGAAIGLIFGAFFALLLNLSVRKKKGQGLAIHTEVHDAKEVPEQEVI